jgi:hypothetical protein
VVFRILPPKFRAKPRPEGPGGNRALPIEPFHPSTHHWLSPLTGTQLAGQPTVGTSLPTVQQCLKLGEQGVALSGHDLVSHR